MEARRSLVVVLNNLAGALLGLVTLFAVGRFMGPTPYGMVAFALSMVGMVRALTNLGLSQAHVKRISEGEDLEACVGVYARLRWGLGAVFVSLMVVASLWWESRGGFVDATTLPVVLVMVGYFALDIVRSLAANTFQALRRSAKQQAITLAENLTRMPLVVAFAVLFAGSMGRGRDVLGDWPTRLAEWVGVDAPWSVEQGALALAGAYLLSNIAAVGTAAWLFRAHGFRIGRFDAALARKYWAFALPLAVLPVLDQLVRQMDTFMVGWFWNAQEAGYFYAGQRFVNLLTIVPMAVGTVLFPLMSELDAKGLREGMHAVARTAQRLLSLVMLPAAAFMAVFPEPILRIFVGASFLDAAPVFRLLAIDAGITAYLVVSRNLLMGVGRPRLLAAFGLITAGLNFALNLVFIPNSLLGVDLLGLRGEGAALATVVAKAVAILLFAAASRRTTGSAHFGGYAFKHVLAVGVAGATAWAATDTVLFGADRIWELAGAGLLLFAVYAGVLVALRELTRKDVLFFLDLLHPGKMVRHIRDEVRPPRDR